MDHVTGIGDRADRIVALFKHTFTASEGADEGRLIGTLSKRLIETTPDDDIIVVSAEDSDGLAGAIMFTRMSYDDPRQVFLLAPVAVATARQGKGIGQALIAHGLDQLRARGIDIAVTYGDPAFYGRVGFHPVTEQVVAAPFSLSMPHGWQAQSLTTAPLGRLNGPCTCAAAFDNPAYW